MNPEQIRDALIAEVVKEVWQHVFEQLVENVQKLGQQWKALAVETMQSRHHRHSFVVNTW